MNRTGHSKSSMCAWLFRKGKEANEASFEPDMDLVYEMMDRKIRVHDLINYTLGRDVDSKTASFINWFQSRTTSSPVAPPSASQ